MTPRSFRQRVALVLPFLIVFFFPITASLVTNLVHIRASGNNGIHGADSSAAAFPSDWSPRAWWTGALQKSFSAWWENNCPGRAFFLHVFNQVNYSFLRSSYMMQSGIVVGPDRQLNLKEYVLDAVHQGAFPADQVPGLMEKLERLRTQLQQQGKAFLVITTPDKPSTYPATIPDRFKAYDRSHPRAYDAFVQALAHSDIPFVDGAGMIHQRVAQSPPPYPFFLQGGLHWDTYAAAQVLPALIEKISQLTGKPVTVPTIASVHEVKAKLSKTGSDHDLARLLNLWAGPPWGYECPNIEMNYPPAPDGPGPNIIWAGGSFSLQLLELLSGSPPLPGRPQVPMAFYTQAFFGNYGEKAAPISRRAYENALSASDILVFEINEDMPQTTINGLAPIMEEAFQAPVRSEWDISFAEGGNSEEVVGAGFDSPEASCRRTVGTDATLVVRVPEQTQTYVLTAQVEPYLRGTQVTHQRVEIRVNGSLRGGEDLQVAGVQTVTATFPASGLVRIDFHFPDAVAAEDAQVGVDPHRVAFAFCSVRIMPGHL